MMLSPSIIEHVPHGRSPKPAPTDKERWDAWRDKFPETRGNSYFCFGKPPFDPAEGWPRYNK